MGNFRIVKDDRDYVVVYKPPGMHSAPLKEHEQGTLLNIISGSYPEIALPRGRKPLEGGLIHRLDHETEGLVLFAKNQETLDYFNRLQQEGGLVKQYNAVVSGPHPVQEGFPGAPPLEMPPFTIKSAFRPYGPGRKAVRPVMLDRIPKHKDIAYDRGGAYVTEVVEWKPIPGDSIDTVVRLRRGFRHQIRCHLAWLGYPILHDPLYGNGIDSGENLMLRASGLFFQDPGTGKQIEIYA